MLNKSLVVIIILMIQSLSSKCQDSEKLLTLNYSVTPENEMDTTVVDYINDYLESFSRVNSMKGLDPYWLKPRIIHDSIYDLGLQFLTRGYSLSEFINKHKAVLLYTNWYSDSMCKASVLFAKNDEFLLSDRGKVRAIYEYNVKFINGKPIFINNIDLFIESAHKKKCGIVTYYYQDRNSFRYADAKKTKKLSKEFSVYFNTNNMEFDFIICRDMQELGYCFNFLTSYMVRTSGVANNPNRFLISALNSAYYPHESIHLLAPKTTPGFLWEGIATYFGGSKNQTYKEFIIQDSRLSSEVISYIIQTEEIQWYYNYVFGALLCDYLINDLNIKSIPDFLKSFNSFKELLVILNEDFGVSKKKLTDEITTKYKKYKSTT